MITPRISIITPSYNQGRFLEQTIQSVLSQDYPNLEYIVMDGGSTDNSVEIIQRYADKITYWTSQKDNGQVEAINAGFKHATGQYIAWLNADDVYLPGCIQKAVTTLQANPEAAMVFGQVEVINADGKNIAMFRPVSYRFEDLLIHKTIIPQQAAFFRRSSLDAIGYLNTDLHFALDHELFLRIGKNYPIIAMPDVMAQYRISDTNKGSIFRSKWAAEFIKILDAFFLQHQTDQNYNRLKPKAYAGAYYSGAGGLLDDGLYVQARQWYRIATKFRPRLLLNIRWWVGFARTFVGQKGNIFYIKLKVWLAEKGLWNSRYDWWTGLEIMEKKRFNSLSKK